MVGKEANDYEFVVFLRSLRGGGIFGMDPKKQMLLNTMPSNVLKTDFII